MSGSIWGRPRRSSWATARLRVWRLQTAGGSRSTWWSSRPASGPATSWPTTAAWNGRRGGVVVDDNMRTSDPDIFAIGEVAAHRDMVYGLVAPGYAMAEVAAANLTGAPRAFSGFEMSTKLKLMGVDVASFGNPFNETEGAGADVPRSVRRRLQEAGLQSRGHPSAGRHPGWRRLGLRRVARPVQEREAAPDLTGRHALRGQGRRLQ